MTQRLARDESGMTLILAMIMIALIGVMGAGLLTFVMRDVSAVGEVNQGQKALDIAQAGVQAAKGHLRVDSFRQHFDTNRANDCDEGPRVGDDNWSKATDIYTDPNGYCVGPSTRTADQVGVTRNFGGGKFQVTIECYDQLNDPVSPDPCNGGATGPAPEPSTLASDKKFFKITSTGYDTTAGDGAIRKIEAIYHTSKRSYAPIAFWTPKNMDFNGTKCVSRMSFFAGGNISNTVSGQGCDKTTPLNTPSNTIADRKTTALYRDWKIAPYNTNGRVDASNNPIIGPGFGALGFVCGSNTCSSVSNSNADGYQDYDSTTGTKGQNKKFVAPPAAVNQITFPFDPRNTLGPSGDPSDIVDPGLVEEMRSAAADQGNYFNTTGTKSITTWPTGKIIYFVDGASVDFKVNTGKDQPLAKGVIVVRNGDFTFNNSSNGFEGVIIVIGNGTTTGRYTQTGNVQLDGYVSASGDMKIAGSVTPDTTSIDFTNLNSFYDVTLWSWRELYN